ncbi:MauE/DoxX family redox-associated membrane protein [Nocardia arthritidis]|uniref:MauE/DoxX family redox-associated membrane protein n=1 Tax=Nocardia arthritidis TaxID=228602 RepID=UPI00142DCB29|nr:MauE/DoxX family redox-associated membrane protein [Nocardia arthritidis]
MSTDLWLAVQFALGAVFCTAGVAKLTDFRSFAGVVRDYEMVPVRLVPVVAGGVVAVELLAGAGLATGLALGYALLVAGVLSLVFLAAVVVNLSRGRLVSCGCFGPHSEDISWRTVGRLLVLLAAVVDLAVHRWAAGGSGPVWAGGVGSQDLLAAVGFAVAAVVVAMWAFELPVLSRTVLVSRVTTAAGKGTR